MKKLLSLISALVVCVATVQAQGVIKGTVKDNATGETIIGASVTYAPGKGVQTDIDGNFKLEVPNGTYNVAVQLSSYQLFTKEVKVEGNEVYIAIQLKPNIITEVEVVGDIAISRKTPVAFTNIPAEKIKEQLGSQDLPMILNSTPGVYATNQGGGDGDARITIRGFSQRNVAVMVDGVPMNDMENGQVYWSNWFGLDNITRTIQVQRGLGASKLALPSVGGTMNIITSGYEAKRSLAIKQEYGNNLTLRTVLSYTSGQLKGGWAITAAGSYKRSDGYVENNWSKMWFYYVKVDKKLGDHMLSFSAFGAPQSHAQRAFTLPIAAWSKDLASKAGVADVDMTNIIERGIRYNQHWGNLIPYREVGDSIGASPEKFSERVNYFHKPVLSLRHSWQVNDKFYWSNIAYASFGAGGGTSFTGATSVLDSSGHINFQSIYNNNAYNPFNTYTTGEQISGSYIRTSVNNHNWYGLLSTFNYSPTSSWDISGGIDLRTYRGLHYRKVYNYLGGDVILDNADANNPQNVIRDGEKINYNYDGVIHWGGLFGLAEYKAGNWSAFVNLSSATSAYRRVDYFLLKDTATGDYQKTPFRIFPSFTAKGGANYNLTEHMNVYVNTGFFTRAPRFTNVYNNNNLEALDVKNENVYAGELGYSYGSRKFSANINAYYTVWKNRPVDFPSTVIIDGDNYILNINGMDARHTGIEFDAVYKLSKKLTFEGMFSLGDWVWQSADSVQVKDGIGAVVATVAFDAVGVKVGDAAQMTGAFSIRYEPIKRLYIKAQGTYFGKNYSNFDPTTLNGPNAGRQSWKMPDYALLDVHIGYGFNINKVKFDFRGSMFNLLDTEYISDATNNAFNPKTYDARSAGVFVGMGRRFNTSLTITF